MTVGVVTDNQAFFRERALAYSQWEPLVVNDKWKVVTSTGTTILRIRPDNIEVDSCAYAFNVLIFETPVGIPFV